MYNSAIALLKGIKGEFSSLMKVNAESTFEKIINRVKSNSDQEKYRIPESMPRIKEWVDKRHFGDFSDKYLTVVNKDWDNGIVVDRNTINDSREYLGGDIEMEIKMIVDTVKNFPDQYGHDLMVANGNAFDATAFFATSRPNLDTGGNTIDNLLTGTSSTTYSLAEFETDYKAAKAGLLGLRDKNNNPFNRNARLAVVVPQHMHDVAQTLLAQRQQEIYVSGTKTNLYAGDAEIIINWEQSSSDNDWYLANINHPIKPIVVQERKAPMWNMKDDPFDKQVFYGFDFRMGIGLLNPLCIIKTNN